MIDWKSILATDPWSIRKSAATGLFFNQSARIQLTTGSLPGWNEMNHPSDSLKQHVDDAKRRNKGNHPSCQLMFTFDLTHDKGG
jgi:hypothetical protein